MDNSNPTAGKAEGIEMAWEQKKWVVGRKWYARPFLSFVFVFCFCSPCL